MLIDRLLARRIGMGSDGSRLFRRRRFEAFLPLVDAAIARNGRCRILDVGGEARYWMGMLDLLGTRPVHVTLLNPSSSAIDDSRFRYVEGDARDMSGWADMSFDVVHSNSVLEHVGQWRDMQSMAREIRRLAPSYFVQTPYFWFPLEPHSSTLFFHWLPEPVRLSLVMRKPRGFWSRAPDVESGMALVHSAVLLDKRMIGALFCDAEIRSERVAGFTKSIIAVRADAVACEPARAIQREAVSA